MDNQKKIELAKRNLWQAIDDYRAHTYETRVLDGIMDRFVNRLAEDNTYAKAELRELFRTSPVWDEELDALVINGTRTHNPNFQRIQNLADTILHPARLGADTERLGQIRRAVSFFAQPEDDPTPAIQAIERLAPRAYAPNKKPSRIFKALCDALHVSDDHAGSKFQKLYAQFADELSARKIDFKLYVSLNPAHFLTMSNPKYDRRGDTLTSCHSFNYTDYEYNNGCSGYARDDVTFLAFLAADPNCPETLNNRKTMRQIFAYKAGNGVLLQSRLYNTSGGTYGAQEDSKLYRDLVQRELSDLEHVPNLWNTYTYYANPYCEIRRGEGFGGYPDWTYENFDAKISIRKDCAEDFTEFSVGTYGLCIHCGCEIDAKLYCPDCYEEEEDEEEETCQCCGEPCRDTYTAYNSSGHPISVCASCRERHYVDCAECGEYHPRSRMMEMEDGRRVCRRCRERMEAEERRSA